MKNTLTISFLFFFISSFSQNLECKCGKQKLTEENIYKCDITTFENNAKLYWQWNCKSSWLTFENKNKKITLSSCDKETPYECQRTGLNFIKEYPNYLLFIHKWTSGCCTSPDMIFISKEDGTELNRITSDQFVWGDADEDYILYFADENFKNLVFLDNNNDKKYSFMFNEREILNSIEKNKVLKMNDLFNNFEKHSDYIQLEYKNADGEIKEINIPLK